jgi:two-component system sensor histidine kinase SenX3
VGNLVENAVVYSDPGARVVVTAALERTGEDDVVEIRVSDNGIGIPAGELERIFERFYRVDYARSRANGGTGLGLSIVKHIAAIHGGDVRSGARSAAARPSPSSSPPTCPRRPRRPRAAERAAAVDHEPQEAKR